MACGGALGSMGFGSGPFGSGTTLELSAVEQVSLNSVRVTFAGTPPTSSDPATYWDALNVANWSLEPFDPFDATIRLVQFVEREEIDEPSVLLVYFDGELDADATYRLIVSGNVKDVYGHPIGPFCASLLFETFAPAFVDPLTAASAASGGRPADLRNPQVPRDAGKDAPLGTLQVTTQGDYDLERGTPYLRKRILRRAMTALGGFFHLPAYGFAEPLKSLITPDVLRRMQARARVQILQEPDVAQASVTVFVDPRASNVVVVDIKAVDINGSSVQVTVPIPIAPE